MSPRPALPRARAVLAAAVGAAIAVCASGCTSVGPKPWQHDLMAKREMQPNPYPLIAGADDHIYFSKEASSGGRGFAGGGCRCN